MPLSKRVIRGFFKWAGIVLGEEIVRTQVPHYLPYAILVIFAYITWEVLERQPVRGLAKRAYSRCGDNRMSYAVIFLLGGGLLCFYWWGINEVFARFRPAPPATENISQAAEIAALGKRLDNFSSAFTQSPLVDSSAQLEVLRQEHARLSEKKNDLSNQETLNDQALTLESLEKRRKQNLEKIQVEKRQKEVADQQEKIERETKQRKANEANELLEKQYAEQYIPIFDTAIGTLDRMLRDISKQSSEETFTDFPNDRRSIHGSAMLKDGKIVNGEHLIRVGSNKEWEFHIRTIVPSQGSSMRRPYFRIEAGGVSVLIQTQRIPTIPNPLYLSLTEGQSEGYHELYRDECSLTDYKKPIERVLMELIQNRYNAAPLKPKP